MKTSTMTVKGQVTVPKELRDAFGWKVGDEVAFLREKDGVKIVRAERQRRGRATVERHTGASCNRKLTADRLMAIARAGERWSASTRISSSIARHGSQPGGGAPQ